MSINEMDPIRGEKTDLMRMVCCLIIAVAWTGGIGFAEEKKPSLRLDTVVVTAEPEEESFRTGDVDLEQSSAFYSRITRDQFEAKVADLSGVLEKEAGVQIRRTGALGAFSSVSLRGAESAQVKVFLDGIPLNDASGGGVDLSHIALSDVAAVEIFRGTTPGNFGQASIGGAVNIKTRRQKKGVSASASAGYGSFDTRELSAFLNAKPGKWDILVSGEYLGAENDFEYLNDNGTDLNPDDDRWEKRHNAAFDQGNLLVKWGYDFSPDLRFDLMNQWYQKEQEIPSWNNSPRTRTTFDTQRYLVSARFTADNLGSLGINTATRLDYSFKEEEYDDQGGHVGLGRQRNRYRTEKYGLHFHGEWPAARHSLGLTLELRHEDYDPQDLLKPESPNDSQREVLALALQDSLFFFADQWVVTPGLRFEALADELQSGTSPYGMELEKVSRNEADFSPQIGILYRPLPWLSLKSNLGRYVRQPSFFELFGDRGVFNGNPDLVPEKGINFDLGAEARWGTPFESVQEISLSLAWFRNQSEDLITRVYDARGVGKADNISEARIQGVEAGVNVEFLDRFRISASGTWQDPENQSDIAVFEGKQLPGRFKESYRIRAEAGWGEFKFYGELLAENQMYYDTVNLLPAEDKTIYNLGVSWVHGPWLVRLDGENLGDDPYEDFNGYPMPGRSVMAAVKYEF